MTGAQLPCHLYVASSRKIFSSGLNLPADLALLVAGFAVLLVQALFLRILFVYRDILMNDRREQTEANLRQHVDRLAGLIGPRRLKMPKTIDATIGSIESQWSEMGYSNDRECYDALGDEATNLIVEQPGNKRADEIVLLGAHYDTVSTTPGADDNASAVAVLLEVSRLLPGNTSRRTARYVAFAREEPPYFNLDSMGSQHHARESRRRGDNIVGMLCLEMVDYYRDSNSGVSRLFSSLMSFLKNRGKSSEPVVGWQMVFKECSTLRFDNTVKASLRQGDQWLTGLVNLVAARILIVQVP